jgi:transposase
MVDFAGILQADAFAEYNRLYRTNREQSRIMETSCWAHARRKLFVLADIAANARRDKSASPISPLALEAVRRIDALFDIERAINGQSQEHRLAARREHSAPLLTELEAWMRGERARLSRQNSIIKAMDYMLRRWETFTVFLHDGRVCLTNNAAERALRGIATVRSLYPPSSSVWKH